MATDDECVELTEADYVVVSTNFSPERAKELEDQGIILNYKIVSGPSDPRSDHDKVLAHYHASRAKHHMGNLLIPLICHSSKNPTDDVIGHPATQYVLFSARGHLASEGKAN
jgi:hypothetical protein